MLAVIAGMSQLISLNSPHRPFYLITRAMKSIGAKLVHCLFDAQWPSAMNHSWSYNVCSRHASDQLVVSSALSTQHQIEYYERFMLELITGSVRLHQPFADQPLPIPQHREKAILVRIDPLRESPVLLERRSVGNVSSAHKRIENAV